MPADKFKNETLRNETPPPGRRLRISLVTETWPPEINGVAHTLGQLTRGLERDGHALELIRPRQHADDTPAPRAGFAEMLVAGMPIPFYPALRIGLPAPRRLLRHWQAHRPDIVHIATEGPLGLAALGAAERLGIPVSSSFHSNFDAYSRHYGVGWLHGLVTRHLRRFHNRTALTLVPTHAMQRQLVATGYAAVDILARGVDTALFNPARRSQSLRAQWGAAPETRVVACIGRLAAEKNLALVLEAFAAIRRQHPDSRLLFVGDGPLRRQLQRSEPEHIYAGMRTGADLACHYASADLFLFPSMTETFGNVTLEALASGLPVVAFDLAAAAELVRNGANGQVVPAGDAAAFIAAGVALAAQSSAHLAAMRERATQSVAAHGWERIQAQFACRLGRIVRDHTQ